MNYAAEMDRILAEYTAASRLVVNAFLDADERATRGGGELSDTLQREFHREQQRCAPSDEMEPQEPTVERDPVLQKDIAVERTYTPRRSKEVYVLPSDWTDEDEEGYGPPKSWLV
ncbi:hypothetical protein [Nocardia sp. CNY236]|uniref:hypothetical protein n=1 Tax=Nocardia sp. CNY236 TaxID=1169152 RepID=UPI00041842BB|nr:hypothetical protein [Nocardia sp. CNY236]